MPTVQHNFTAAQLSALRGDGVRYELVEGELRMMSPAGGRHGWIAARLNRLLGNHVEANRLGVVFAAETGFLIATDPDTVRAPDVAFVSQARMASVGDQDLDGYLPLAPDLVAEIVSPNDTSSEVEAKAAMWIEAGTKMVLVVDPANQSVRVYRDRSAITILQQGEELDADAAVTGWRLPIGDLFPAA